MCCSRLSIASRTLILENAPSLRDFKLRAQELEACENRANGRTGDQRNNLASGKPSADGANFAQSQKSARNNHASNELSSTVAPYASVTCCQCHQPGHKRDSCPQLASSNPKRSPDNHRNAPNDRNMVATSRDDVVITTRSEKLALL